MSAAKRTPSEDDELLIRAIEVVVAHQKPVSVTTIQRRVYVTWARACFLLARLEELGVVGPSQGGRSITREVLITVSALPEFLASLNLTPASEQGGEVTR